MDPTGGPHLAVTRGVGQLCQRPQRRGGRAARWAAQHGLGAGPRREERRKGGKRKQAAGGGGNSAEPKSSEGESKTFSFLFPISLFF